MGLARPSRTEHIQYVAALERVKFSAVAVVARESRRTEPLFGANSNIKIFTQNQLSSQKDFPALECALVKCVISFYVENELILMSG